MIQSPDADAVPETAYAATDARGADRPGLRDRWWLVPAVLLAGFVLLLWQVKAHGPVTGLDIRVRDRIQSLAGSPSMTWMFHPGRAMADLGNQSVALPFLLGIAVLTGLAARSWRPLLVTAGALAALATVVPLKVWIDRPGPGQLVLGDAKLGYFPSGHTADAVLCYGTSALLLCLFVFPGGHAYSRLLRGLSWTGAAVLVLATIFGLLWSDFHWLSDALGSLCWCGAALYTLHHLARRYLVKHSLIKHSLDGRPREGEGNSGGAPLA
jgi:undecaprenyl-diphosphatase